MGKSAPVGDRTPDGSSNGDARRKAGCEVCPEAGSMVAQVPLEVARGRRVVAGPERGRTGTLETDSPKAPGRPDLRDVLVAHVALDRVGQAGVDLQPDFVDLCVAQKGGSSW